MARDIMSPLSAQEAPSSLRVATYNTWQGSEPYATRLALMLEGIATLQPDILLLQEVFCVAESASAQSILQAAPNILERLVDEQGYEYIFYPARQKVRRYGPHALDSYSGLAIAYQPTKGITLRDSQCHVLPELQSDGERNLLHLELAMGEVTCHVFNTHLTHINSPDQHRLRQCQQVLAYIESVLKRAERKQAGHAQSNYPNFAILGGDFNAQLSSEDLLPLSASDFKAFPMRRGSDSRALGSLLPAPAEGGGMSHEGKARLTSQVDHLFVLDEAKHYTWPNHAELALNAPTAHGLYPSDHALVYLDAALS